MKTIKTNIIPTSPTYVEIEAPKELDLKAICIFAATGFFLDTDTYFQHKKALSPASIHTFDAAHKLIDSKPWFQWHYTPRDITFNEALEEFSILFEQIMEEQTRGKQVILPLSGGLDGRTQAVALQKNTNVFSYSYAFKNGYPEHKIAKRIAKKVGFKFESFEVKEGYLWDCIDELANINQCYSDFTHPRQMAFVEDLKNKGDVFSLGHWGDVLFDSMNLPQLTAKEEADVILKKIIKKGGLELATSLWQSFGLEGTFKCYLEERILKLVTTIQIKDTNAKLRAFKSKYWAPRWTSINLSIFETLAPIELPYYDDRMCEFICTIPEEFLKDRKLQIAYIKKKAPKLAKIVWQEKKPFNLNTYQWNRPPYNLPYRVLWKLNRALNKILGNPLIQRNWELQFIGKENDAQLKKWLFKSDLGSLIPNEIIQQFYTNFKEKDTVNYAHPVSMLLTLAVFNKKFNK
ncbi:MAG TPA: asparagine synthase-related protein [Lutibacter sp.]